jgi:hypothetical protein
MKNNSSNQCQDLFVLSVLDKKTNGTYVEIGGGLGMSDGNNTYMLESAYGWKGFALEHVQWIADTYSVRKNPCLCMDATSADYGSLFKQHNLGFHIDYLQLDIEPPANTLRALKQIDLNKYSFSVITFEHDAYQGGENEREESRNLLDSYGYTRVISNVMHKGWALEDWYINEKYMPNNNWREFIGENIELHTPNEKYTNLFAKFLN